MTRFRARLQYDLTQQELLLEHIPNEISDRLLQTALDNHRLALQHDPEHTDLLFNTGQILTSTAEEAIADNDDLAALSLYREALQFFQRCLDKQEKELGALLQLGQASTRQKTDTGDGDLQNVKSDVRDVWTRIEETVSPEALYDTLIEMESTLSSMCAMSCPFGEEMLEWVKNQHDYSVCEKLLTYAKQIDRETEAMAILIRFRLSFCGCAFLNGHADMAIFERECTYARKAIVIEPQDPGWVSRATILADANIQTGDILQRKIQMNLAAHCEQWEVDEMQKKASYYLGESLGLLASITHGKVGEIHKNDWAAIHLRRGDCELAMRWLGQTSHPYLKAQSSTTMLAENVKTYYADAYLYAEEKKRRSQKEEAAVKGAITSHLLGETQALGWPISAYGIEAVHERAMNMAKRMLLVDADVHSLEQQFSQRA